MKIMGVMKAESSANQCVRFERVFQNQENGCQKPLSEARNQEKGCQKPARMSHESALVPALQALTRLRTLDLSRNSLGRRGVKMLVKAVEALTALRRMEVQGSRMPTQHGMH